MVIVTVGLRRIETQKKVNYLKKRYLEKKLQHSKKSFKIRREGNKFKWKNVKTTKRNFFQFRETTRNTFFVLSYFFQFHGTITKKPVLYSFVFREEKKTKLSTLIDTEKSKNGCGNTVLQHSCSAWIPPVSITCVHTWVSLTEN